MTDEWNEFAGDWDTNPAVIQYSEKAFESLITVISPDNLTILDFGCGTGLLTEKLSSHAKRVVALDSSTEMTNVLRHKNLANVTVVNDFLTSELIETNDCLQDKFNLIVASSVCGFLPNYAEIVGLFESMLVSEGLFVQWDWLSDSDKSEIGMSVETVATAFDNVGLETPSLREGFSLESGEGTMPVLMAIGKKAQ